MRLNEARKKLGGEDENKGDRTGVSSINGMSSHMRVPHVSGFSRINPSGLGGVDVSFHDGSIIFIPITSLAIRNTIVSSLTYPSDLMVFFMTDPVALEFVMSI